ncbi:NAD(P)-binding domain-containing protein [Streptomyces iconiensis]|uniref:NAD(P)-binding domain-containing protein n=1 Tax=Streptomyces iconiensis TaxID=1384038 RepID=A0ABT7ABP3_9ACTN|nr:NAD(P)-binding domain-containing protein [Streptomyces iconiensis]MDJ1138236.1 NAD(P)-binding domain-containing protein [Streptomyces iconiensis]
MEAPSRPSFRVMLRMEIHPGTSTEFERVWWEVGSGIAREPANRGQSLVRSVEDENTYYVITDWADERSFRAFELSEAHVENRRRLQPYRAGGEMTLTRTVHELPPTREGPPTGEGPPAASPAPAAQPASAAGPVAPPASDHEPEPPLAFIGLGNMGGGMAARLLEAGRTLTVHNRTAGKAGPLAEAGATVAATPAEAAKGHSVVLLSLADEAAVEKVLFEQVVPVLAPGAIVIDTSTVSPDYARTCAARLATAGIRRVEACVVGNPFQAREGKLRVYTSGGEGDIAEVAGVLDILGAQVVHLGAPGTAATLKLIFNLLLGAQVTSLAEAVAYGVAAGLDRDRLLTSIAESGFSSVVMRFRAELMRKAAYEPAFFRSTLMEKDLRLALGDAALAGVPLPVLDSVRERFARVNEAGDGDKDASVVIEHTTAGPRHNGAGVPARTSTGPAQPGTGPAQTRTGPAQTTTGTEAAS